METAFPWSRVAEGHRSVTEALHGALGAHAGTGLAMSHLSHGYRDGACLYFTALWPLDDGRPLEQWAAIKRDVTDAIVAAGIGHVPEGREIFPDFSVRENLLVGAHTVPRREVDARLGAAWELFPALRERHAQRAGTLSGGEQQMLAIARALMARPRLLLLDEPSLGLAPRLTREIFRVVERINRTGVTVLLVEQNARRALAVAARGYVLETGRVAVAGASASLTGDSRIRAAYLGLAEPKAP